MMRPRTLVPRGKWSDAAVPHHNWISVGVEDLRDRQTVCEMCEFQLIRYAHTMRHADYPQDLVVGCDCAGFMSGDHEGVEERDREMRNRGNRLRNFLTKGWKNAGPGTASRVVDGIEVTVHEDAKVGWSGSVLDKRTSRTISSTRKYAGGEELMIAAFAVVESIRLKRRAQRSRASERAIAITSNRPVSRSANSRTQEGADVLRREAEQRLGMRIVNGRLRPL